jgi:hypothetical protein
MPSRDRDLHLPCVGEHDDGLTGAHDLPRFRRYCGDDPGVIRPEGCILDRICRLAQLRLGRVERRCGRIQFVASGVVGRPSNDRFRQEGPGAINVVARHIAAGPRAGHCGLGTVLGKLQVHIVEASNYLTHLDAIADVNRALDDLTRHSETKRALDPGPHHPRIGQDMSRRRCSDHGNLDRARDVVLDLGFLLAAANEAD